jgi:predicted TIM-barrel fold metal-dependent hydrolase
MLAPVYEMIEATGRTTSANAIVIDLDADETEISLETVWTMKGARAPGAISLERRLGVLDTMGVDRQLIFPGFGLFGIVMVSSTRETLEQQLAIDTSGFDFQAMALEIQRAHNEWALREAKADPSRLRAVCVLCCTSDFDLMMSEAEHLLAEGARAIQIPASVPPAGKSPADRAIDPFWSLFEEADAAVLLHLGSEASFFSTRVWGLIPDFEPEMTNLEFPLDPYSFSTVHMAQENFVLTAALGGVFERHPALRFGVIECGAHWVGPMAENIDMWASKFPNRLKKTLSMPPSEYVRRNVRVTPYHFEPVDRYIERFGLEDVYAYSSDYPHAEGGKEPLRRFAERLAPLGDDIVEKFFVTNGQWLMPD